MAVETKEHAFEGRHFLVATVDLEKESLQLFLSDGNGHYFNNFANIPAFIAKTSRRFRGASQRSMLAKLLK